MVSGWVWSHPSAIGSVMAQGWSPTMTECSWTDTLEKDTVFFDLGLASASFVAVTVERRKKNKKN